MAGSLVPVTELGFAEFTASLISQTLEAVISAYADQERKLLELRRVAALSPEAYASELGASLDVAEEVGRRFPPPQGSTLASAVDAGAPYRPATAKLAESPAIEQLTGYRMVASRDYQQQKKAFTITSAGYTGIFKAVELELARAQLLLVQGLAVKGLPKVLVDNGRVSSKLVFKLYETQAATSSATLPGLSAPATLSKMLMVAPVHAKGPEFLALKADIVGEVEITFKTITE